MEVGRLHRVLKLVTDLQVGRSHNASQLAAECGVSRRTICRDLNIIEKAGIPVFFDRASRRYQIHPTALIPPLNLSLDEALALVLLASELGRTGGLPLFQPARDAAAKIEASLPLGLRAEIGAMTLHMAVRTGPMARHNALQEAYRTVQRAIQKREPLETVYVSFQDAGQIHTRLEPYWLLFNERAWYVIGRSSVHGDVRAFKLGRFKSLRPGQGHFALPKGLTLDKHLGNAWQMMRGAKTYEVQLRFSPLIGPHVAEVNWHKTQRITWDEDGAVLFSATVDGLDEILWWILGYGPEVEVLKPKELRDKVAGMARRMIDQYKRV